MPSDSHKGFATMKTFARYAIAATALAAALPAVQADAATLVVNVAGVQSYGALGDAANIVNSYNLGAGAVITGISYNVNITAFNPSYLSEISLSFGDTDQTTGVFFSPGFLDSNPGTASYADSADLVALGLDFAVGADGLLRLEYFEDFDDASVAPDGIWNSGNITFTYTPGATAAVPEPTTWAMMIGGFGMVGFGLRRRSSVKTTVAYA